MDKDHKTSPTYLRLEKELKQRLKKQAIAEKRKLTDLARLLIVEGLDRREHEVKSISI